MPNWKKVVVSGSATSLSSLYVDTSLTASVISGSQISGSLFGTASHAISSSYSEFALTASYALNVPTSSVSSSYAISASYAETASFASAFPDQGFQYTQSPGASTWNILHGLNTLTPLVDVYDSNYHQLIPADIISVDSNNIQIVFSTPQAGYAIISKGSGISAQIAVSASYASYAVTASYASTVGFNFEQISPSSTWTINHNLNNRHPLVQIYDSNHLTFIPQSISGSSANTVIVTFSSATSGYARVV